jgi:hypothetical protein
MPKGPQGTSAEKIPLSPFERITGILIGLAIVPFPYYLPIMERNFGAPGKYAVIAAIIAGLAWGKHLVFTRKYRA